ncbi:MAG: cadmium-translocating P-type ATPase [Acidobacteria bacterium]|jgi:Cu+-exporting ATPase|nr:MAG: cadmium-translocating P-type ATPase [Acidobacteriota bacterium]GIU83068.1 MAG: copper-translocating P-type ATPase [Pyrinomonadaceae bacterium]
MIQLTRKSSENIEVKVDPVCKMLVQPATAAAFFRYKNEDYYFCAIRCYNRFRQNPEKFLSVKPEATESTEKSEYTCPMHPEITKIGHGFCSICGMALEPKFIASASATEAEDPEFVDMKRRFAVSTVLTVPIFLLAMSEMLFGSFLELSVWIQLILATPVVFWGGFPFFVRAVCSIKNLSPNMFTLIAIGTASAYFYSLLVLILTTFFPTESLLHVLSHDGKIAVYFEASAVITTLVLLGQVLELKARMRTSSAIKELLNLTPKEALVVFDDGTEAEIPVDELLVGTKLRVRANEKIPTDGIILEGETYVDESMITGESVPVYRKAGDRVIGGTLNGGYSFLMRAEKVGNETLLANIVRMVSEAQRSRAPIQNLADKVSAYFVPAVILIALIAFVTWLFLGNFIYAFVSAVSVLIIACPCALGLATPMSIMVGTGRGAKEGILIKNAEALQALEKINTVVIDKTGTLTEGKLKLRKIMLEDTSFSEDEVLRYAASVERISEHPLAKAIVDAASERNLKLEEVHSFRASVGEGVSGQIGEKLIEVKRPSPSETVETMQAQGYTVVEVSVDGKTAAYLGISDEIKESAAEVIEKLHHQGISVIMMTGDNRKTAELVGKKLKVDEIFAEVYPWQKAEKIKELQSRGKRVAMAGDGVNDAPALAQADVGIAFASGSDIAVESAGITLLKSDLKGILKAHRLARLVMKNIRQNLFFAFVYNFLSVPIAAGVLFPFLGILLSPMIASAAMTFSSVSVIFNALRLKNARLS